MPVCCGPYPAPNLSIMHSSHLIFLTPISFPVNFLIMTLFSSCNHLRTASAHTSPSFCTIRSFFLWNYFLLLASIIHSHYPPFLQYIHQSTFSCALFNYLSISSRIWHTLSPTALTSVLISTYKYTPSMPTTTVVDNSLL